jgi:hypothetical protein
MGNTKNWVTFNPQLIRNNPIEELHIEATHETLECGKDNLSEINSNMTKVTISSN